MNSGAVHFFNTGSNLPEAAQPADWFEHGQMIIVCGKVFRRYRKAAMYRSYEGRLFLKIDTLEETSEEVQALDAGVYFNIPCRSRLTDCKSLVIKPGIHYIYSVVRMCRFKVLMGQNEVLWTIRRRLLQAIAESYLWLETGVYELSLSKFDVQPKAEIKSLINTARPPNFKSGEITRQERLLLESHLDSWRRRAIRTERLDQSAVKEAINQLYFAFGLAAPRVVFVPSPLVLAIAGSLATALCCSSKPGQLQANNTAAFKAVATREVYSAAVEAAFRSTDNYIDETTLGAFERIIEQSGVAAAARSFGGAAGTPIEHALNDATNVGVAYNLLEQSANFQRCIPGNVLAAASLASGREPSHSALLKHSGNKENKVQPLLRKLAAYYGGLGTIGEQFAGELCGGRAEVRELMLSCLRQSTRSLEIGNRQSYDECLTTALTRVFGLRLTGSEDNALWQNIVTKCGAIILHQDFCMVSDFPQVINLDNQGRPHCEDGPSYVYRDGWALYHWHGTRVTSQIIERMETVTVDDIKSESNLEVRRIMLDRYGAKRFLLDCDAQEVHRDQCGVLYSQVVHPMLEPIVLVKVVNATAEPDGTFKDYYLRVPPHIRTAKDAVAWTFGERESNYSPSIQT